MIYRDLTEAHRWTISGAGSMQFVEAAGFPDTAEIALDLNESAWDDAPDYLNFLSDQAKQAGYTRMMTYCANDRKPSYRFFLAQQFTIDHAEWKMVRPYTMPLPQIDVQQSIRVVMTDAADSAPQFRALYDDSFSPHAWYQHWADDDEVCHHCDVIAWCKQDNSIVGFAGLQYQYKRVQLEPFGIVPAWQGQGIGRQFLTRLLATEDQTDFFVTVWEENAAAIALYQSLGFMHRSTGYWLIRDI